MLLGPHGIGKSATLNFLQGKLRRQGHQCSILNMTGLDYESFVWQLGESLGCFPEDHRSLAAIWRDIFDRIQVNRYQQTRTVLMFDDADGASPQMLDSVLRLVQWKTLVETQFTILLAADSARMMRLGRRLIELAHLRIDLQPWELEESSRFLKRSVQSAGSDQTVFDVRALERIYRLAEGYPLRLRQLAELALVAGAGQHLENVDVETVDAVQEELRFAVTTEV